MCRSARELSSRASTLFEAGVEACEFGVSLAAKALVLLRCGLVNGAEMVPAAVALRRMRSSGRCCRHGAVHGRVHRVRGERDRGHGPVVQRGELHW